MMVSVSITDPFYRCYNFLKINDLLQRITSSNRKQNALLFSSGSLSVHPFRLNVMATTSHGENPEVRATAQPPEAIPQRDEGPRVRPSRNRGSFYWYDSQARSLSVNPTGLHVTPTSSHGEISPKSERSPGAGAIPQRVGGPRVRPSRNRGSFYW